MREWKTRIRYTLFGPHVFAEDGRLADPEAFRLQELFAGPYRAHFICLECRKGFKGDGETLCHKCRRPCADVVGDICPGCHASIAYLHHKSCPDCHRPMLPVSKDFETPRRQNLKAWRYIQELASQVSPPL